MKTELAALIIDDDDIFTELFISVYEEAMSSYGIQPQLQTANFYTEELLNVNYGIVFLDIQLPGSSGFEVSKLLPTSCTRIVYISAFDHYVFDSFEHRAYGFIRKHKLQHDLRNLLKRYLSEHNNTIEITKHGKDISILTDRIWLISVNGNYTTVHFDDSKVDIKISLRRFEESNAKQLENRFVHISRHMIVNMDYVELVEHNQIFMKCKIKLYMSRAYSAQFLQRYYTYRKWYAL